MMNNISLDRWYALTVHNGQEASIRAHLLDQMSRFKLQDEVRDIVLPSQDEIVNPGQSNQETVQRRKLPGYLLLRCRRLSPMAMGQILKSQGVMEFLGGNENPTPLPLAEVRRMIGSEAPVMKVGPRFAAGETIKVVKGPMTDFAGEITSVNATKRTVKVDIEIFGRRTPVELAFDLVAAQ